MSLVNAIVITAHGNKPKSGAPVGSGILGRSVSLAGFSESWLHLLVRLRNEEAPKKSAGVLL